MFLREDNGGSLVLARHGGYGLCVEETATGLVLVQSAPGMDQGRGRELVTALQAFADSAGEVPDRQWFLGWA